jgi:hypothetical protein
MFKVRTISRQDYRYRDKWEVITFLVSDIPTDYNNEVKWPTAVEFHVSTRYDEETQKRRALEYCNYLNKGIVVQPPIGK